MSELAVDIIVEGRGIMSGIMFMFRRVSERLLLKVGAQEELLTRGEEERSVRMLARILTGTMRALLAIILRTLQWKLWRTLRSPLSQL